MKLKKNFVLNESDNEAVLVATGGSGFAGFLRGNSTCGEILEMLGKDTTEERIVRTLREKYNAPEGAVEKDVKKVLGLLRKAGALEE